MHQNRIRRTTPKRTPNSHPQFFIRRSEIVFDKRARYVESVCATLIESRFGASTTKGHLLRDAQWVETTAKFSRRYATRAK